MGVIQSCLSSVQGRVANFVETEQLVELRAESSSKAAVVSSFVQVRGSIPLLWSQIPSVKYKPTTLVSPPQAYEPAFDNHINDLLSSYQVACWTSPLCKFIRTHTCMSPLLHALCAC